MNYFSVEFVFACGIIVGVALAIAVQSLWHDFRRAARHH